MNGLHALLDAQQRHIGIIWSPTAGDLNIVNSSDQLNATHPLLLATATPSHNLFDFLRWRGPRSRLLRFSLHCQARWLGAPHLKHRMTVGGALSFAVVAAVVGTKGGGRVGSSATQKTSDAGRTVSTVSPNARSSHKLDGHGNGIIFTRDEWRPRRTLLNIISGGAASCPVTEQ